MSIFWPPLPIPADLRDIVAAHDLQTPETCDAAGDVLDVLGIDYDETSGDLVHVACVVVAQATTLARFSMPRPHENYVIVSTELVDEMMAAPSRPVTVSITKREDGRLEMVFTDADAPGLTFEQALRVAKGRALPTVAK